MRARDFLLSASIVAGLAITPRASAQHLELPSGVIALDSVEGQKLLESSKAKVDFYPLSEHFVTQQTQGFCGVASAVMVLNALQVKAPEVEAWSPYRVFTQENLFNDAANKVHPASAVNQGGMTIDQLGDLLQCHPAQAKVVHAGNSSLESFRSEASKNLATAGDFVIVNWDRAGVGMDTMGHISPLGAYDEASDKFLLMDVARYKYAPHWVDAAALFRAMSTNDLSSGGTRGWVSVTRAASAPGPTGAKARNMFRLLLTVVGAVFLLGIAIGSLMGWLVTRARWKKRLAVRDQPSKV